ncbi:MAG: thioredoxin family protein [Actinomycetota bacterium]|nr:thioredoxin family protein [Actinomycetota bacterium]
MRISMRVSLRCAVIVLIALTVVVAPQVSVAESHAAPQPEVTLYFFWGEGCPHCAAAEPTLAQLTQRYPQLRVRSYEVWGSDRNQELFAAMAAKFGIRATGTPTFFLGRRHWVGFDESTTPKQLDAAIRQCLAAGCPDAGAGVVHPGTDRPPTEPPTRTPPPEPADGVLDLPVIGEVDLANQSLVLGTALIAVVDGVNPCSLWVLSVLLALTLRTGSRRTIALVGLVFISVTAAVYALFIAGLFSLFSVVDFAPWVRVLVALIAAAFAAINIKDYFWFKKGVSLTIPETTKPGIYQRMRRVLAVADSMPALVVATALLAAGVSFVELACTAGFPVLWTNMLAIHEVSALTFAMLLGLYMLIYQLDELVIFGAAVLTMRATKLQEKQGRVLKLVGGMLMLSLALVMLVNPALMSDIATSLLVFGAAALATLVVLLVDRFVLPRSVHR